MRKKVKQLLAIVCALALVMQFSPLQAYARSITDVQQEINEKREQLTALESQIQNSQDDIEQAQAALREFEVQYNELVALIDEQEELINNTAAELDAKGQELSATIESIQHNRDMYTERLQAIYQINSTNAAMATLLSINSFSDFIMATEAIQRISQHDTELLEQLAAEKELYEQQKQELEQTMANLNEEMATLQENRDWCTDKMEQMQGVIANANYQIEVSEQQAEQTAADMQQLQAELAAIFEELQNSGSQAGDGSAGYVGPLLWPVPGYSNISSYFGDPRSNTGYHYGIDIPAGTGTPVVASASGIVLTATWHYSYGYYVVLDHGQGLRTLYAHNSALYVSVGQAVTVGQTIAGVGNTGESYGAHLHFEVHANGGRQDPLGSGYLAF